MKLLTDIDENLKLWLESQHIFFVATAPLSESGHVNCSPKGGDCFRVFGPLEAGYLDYTGSGAETVSHLRENGRIVIMFCAFDGKPNIVRLHGHGTATTIDNPKFAELMSQFPSNPGARSVIHVHIDRVSTSCGFSVPLMDFQSNREVLNEWAYKKGRHALADYRSQKNITSIDGLPAFAPSTQC